MKSITNNNDDDGDDVDHGVSYNDDVSIQI